MLVVEPRSLALSISRIRIDVGDPFFFPCAALYAKQEGLLHILTDAFGRNSNDIKSYNRQFATESTVKCHAKRFPHDAGSP